MKKLLLPLAKNALLLLFSLVLFLAAAELIVRSLGLVNRLHNRCVNYRHPRVGYLHLPNISTFFWLERNRVPYKANNLGFRDYDRRAEKEPGVFRILVLGDSFVESPYVALDKTFPAILEKEFNKDGKKGKVEFINLGRMGLGTVAELELLKDTGMKLKPDCVLLVFFMNDVRNNYYPPLNPDGTIDSSYPPVIDPYIFHIAKRKDDGYIPVEAESYPPRTPLSQFINKHLHLYQFLGDSFPRLRQIVHKGRSEAKGQPEARKEGTIEDAMLFLKREPKGVSLAWETTAFAFQEMKNLLSENQIPLYVLYIPADYETDRTAWIDEMRAFSLDPDECEPRLVESKLKSICEQKGITFISLLDYGCKRDFYFKSNPHLNEAGQKFAAGVLSGYFEKIIVNN